MPRSCSLRARTQQGARRTAPDRDALAPLRADGVGERRRHAVRGGGGRTDRCPRPLRLRGRRVSASEHLELTLYDSLTKTAGVVEPRTSGELSMYICGPTV